MPSNDRIAVVLTREQVNWILDKAIHAGDGTDLVAVSVYNTCRAALARPEGEVWEAFACEQTGRSIVHVWDGEKCGMNGHFPVLVVPDPGREE